MILVKNLVIILLARFTQDSDMILVKKLVRNFVIILLANLPKILNKNYQRFSTRITQDS